MASSAAIGINAPWWAGWGQGQSGIQYDELLPKMVRDGERLIANWDHAASKGLHMLLHCRTTDGWANPNTFANFVNSNVSTFRNHAAYSGVVELGNEPFWPAPGGPPATPQNYATNCRVAIDLVNQNFPGQKFIVAVDDWPTAHDTSPGTAGWVQQMLATEPTLKTKVYGWALHPYGDSASGNPATDTATSLSHVQNCINALNANGASSTKIWATEWGWSRFGNPPSTESQQANNAAYFLDHAPANVEAVFWYQINDNNGTARDSGFGLYTAQGMPPAATANWDVTWTKRAVYNTYKGYINVSRNGNFKGGNTTPGAPTNVQGTAGNAQVSLTWTAPGSNGGAAITGYRITPFIGTSAQAAINTGTTATSRTITGLTNGTTYTFRVAATNSVGTGGDSSPSPSLTPTGGGATAPGAPTNVGGTPGDTVVNLTWTGPGSDGGAAITSYRITPFIGATAQTVINTGSNATSRQVTGLTNGTAYTFKVAATNSVGTGADSAASAAITPVASSTQVILTLDPNDHSQVLVTNVPAGTDHLHFYESTENQFPGTVFHFIDRAPNTTSFRPDSNQPWVDVAAMPTVDNGTPIGQYYSDYSGSRVLTTPAAPTVPNAPTNVQGTAGSNSVSLTWTAPVSDGGAPISSYRITPFIGATAQTPTPTGNTATSAVVSGLINGTTYTFKVAATNSVGTSADSTASGPITPALASGTGAWSRLLAVQGFGATQVPGPGVLATLRGGGDSSVVLGIGLRDGGGISDANGGGVKHVLVRKSNGGVATAAPGGVKHVITPVKTGGGAAIARSGGDKHVLVRKGGGALANGISGAGPSVPPDVMFTYSVGVVAEVSVANFALGYAAASLQLNAYYQAQTSPGRGITVELLTGSTVLSTQTVPGGSPLTWFTLPATRDLTQPQVNDLRIRFTTTGTAAATLAFVSVAYIDLAIIQGLVGSDGGARSNADGGGVKRTLVTKSGGALSTLSAGGKRSVFITRTEGAHIVARGGSVLFVRVNKTAGALSDANAGAAKRTLVLKTGGGISAASGGARKSLELPRVGGAVATLVAGGTPLVQHTITRSGGALARGVSGGVKRVLVRKSSGALLTASGGAVKRAQVVRSGGASSKARAGSARQIFVRKSGGALAIARAGSVLQETKLGVTKVGGGVAVAVAGAIKRATLTRSGGGQLSGSSDALRTVIVLKAGGASAEISASGTNTESLAIVTDGGARAEARAGGDLTIIYRLPGGARSALVGGGSLHVIRAPKPGGAAAVARAGAVKRTLVTKSGGGLAVGVAGGRRSTRVVRSGGAVAVAAAGAIRRILVTKPGGARAAGIGGGNSSLRVLFTKTGGATLVARAGGTRRVTGAVHPGGADAEAVAGAKTRLLVTKSGGALSDADAGALRRESVIHSGGATSDLNAGAIRRVGVVKRGGAMAVSQTGGTKRVLVTRTSGGRAVSRAGGVRRVTVTKPGGGFAPLVGGGNLRLRLPVRTGGAMATCQALGLRSTLVSKPGGGRATSSSTAVKRVLVTKTGGGFSILYGDESNQTVSKRGGADAVLRAGGSQIFPAVEILEPLDADIVAYAGSAVLDSVDCDAVLDKLETSVEVELLGT